MAIRDGRRHPSPNSGWSEAAYAGALGLRLGGANSYGGRVEQRPLLGDGRPPGPADVPRAVRLCAAVTASSAVLAAASAAMHRGHGVQTRRRTAACLHTVGARA
jgi:adenosylcobinamide-phosphate synthase